MQRSTCKAKAWTANGNRHVHPCQILDAPRLLKAASELQPYQHQRDAAVDDAPCSAGHSDLATVMSFVSGGRGGGSRGRGSSPAGPKTTRPSFAPRARGNNQVRFNAQTRGASERGGRGSFRGSNASRGAGRGRGKPASAPTPSLFAAPAQAQTPAPSNHASSSSSFADRFQAVRFLPPFHG